MITIPHAQVKNRLPNNIFLINPMSNCEEKLSATQIGNTTKKEHPKIVDVLNIVIFVSFFIISLALPLIARAILIDLT